MAFRAMVDATVKLKESIPCFTYTLTLVVIAGALSDARSR